MKPGPFVNKGTSVYVYILIAVSSQIPLFGAENSNDLLELLRAKDSSVLSYALSVKFTSIDMDPNRYAEVRNLLNLVGTQDIQDANMLQFSAGIMQKLVPRAKVWWGNVTNLQRGQLFKTIHSFDGEESVVQQYDGQRYMHYQPDAQTKQVDIYPEVQSEVRWDFEELNITLKKLLNKELMSYKEHENSSSLTFAITENHSKIVYAEFDEDAALKYLRCDKNGQLFAERWYLCHQEVDYHFVPRVIFSIRRSQDDYEISCIVVEDVEINGEITDSDLEVSNIPPWAVVVDHHQDPPLVTRAIDAPHVILR